MSPNTSLYFYADSALMSLTVMVGDGDGVSVLSMFVVSINGLRYKRVTCNSYVVAGTPMVGDRVDDISMVRDGIAGTPVRVYVCVACACVYAGVSVRMCFTTIT